MATRTKEGIKRVGLASRVFYYPEAAAQTFKKGQILYLDTAGRVNVLADAGVLAIGIAMQDATGTTDTRLAVDVIMPGDVFEVTCYHATAASAVAADSTVGDPYQFISVSNVTYLNKAGTSTNLFQIIGRNERDSATDVYPRLFVTVINATIQATGAAQG